MTLAVLLAAAALAQPTPAPIAATGNGYYRQPSIHGDTVVFIAEGDLWTVGTSGGKATRLTTHPGPESHPSFSPDGQTIAFLANYEDGGAGTRESGEVYTMPAAGGLPVRRTWGGPANARTTFVGWTPDGKVLYGTREFASLPSVQLAQLDLASNVSTPVPLYEADQGSYTADGKTLIFTRLPFQGSYTRRYKGGYIQQLWRYDIGAPEAVPLTTDYEGISKDAMVIADRVYFATDRDKDAAVVNIWSATLDGKDLKQHTHHTDFDVSYPSADAKSGRIVYQTGADLWVLDTKTGADTKLDIQLVSDFDQMREQWIKKPAAAISGLDISPDGDRIAIVARGRVFVAPAKPGRIVEATRDQGVRHRNVAFMPSDNGKQLLVSSDRSGEVEFWTTPANGVGAPAEQKQVTHDAKVLRWEAVPSPDGTMIAHHDKNLQLWLTTVADGATKLIATTQLDNFGELAWSADSKWLVYVEPAPNTNRQIKIYSVASGQITAATTDRFESFSPRFSPDGKWLYFLSDRTINSTTASPWGPMGPQPYYTDKTRVYQLALKAGTRSPWQPKDEVFAAEEAKKKDEKKDEKKPDPAKEEKKDETKKDDAAKKDEAKKDEPKKDDTKKDDAKKDEKKITPVEIDLDGLASRIVEAPVPAGNYTRLMVNDKALFYGSFGELDDEGTPGSMNLMGLAITNEKPEPKKVAGGVRLFEMSADGKKMLVHMAAPSDTIAVIDAAPAPAEIDKNAVNLSGWSMSVVPGQEWRQMYTDAWRLLRDYFYATNMHGADWPKVRDKYAPLLERIRSRSDLNDVLAQMTAELSTLHHFVIGGDTRASADRAALGHLGADLSRDEAAGGYRVDHVYGYDADEPAACPPLAKPTVNVKDGDVITQVNGVPTLSVPSVSVLLRNQVGRQVLIHVKPKEGAERDAIVVPVSAADAANLRYNQWELQRRQTVEKDGDGQIGYVHLRAMGRGDIAQWAKNFYPVFNRSGLIIDVRRNNGGNIDSWILGQLLRRPWMYWNQRAGRAPAWNMQYAFRGHVVVICDAFTASDGEAFSEGFKRLGLGKVIGTRTWGGEVWLSMSNRLVDEGVASAGELGVFGPDDKGQMAWLVEGRGVEPDMVVDNPPHGTFMGQDAQLKAAIDHVKQMIKDKPVVLPDVPALPDKSFKK
jgi:tricorn protease